MAENVLDEYFVKLSALPDSASFSKFAVTLKDASSLVDLFSTKTIRNIVGMELAAVGAFSAIGLGMIGLADKAAMTDQQYRLFGLHMLMNKDSARAMQMALDDLGATIDEVAFDPELNKRFQELYERNIKLGKILGGSFDDFTFKVRDLRMEYKKFTDELIVAEWKTLEDIFEKLGYGSGDLEDKLSNLNDWFMYNIPNWANELSTDLVPAWQDSKTVVKDFGGLLKQAAGEFTFLVGVLTGDKSIEDTQFNIEHLTKAFVDLLDKITEVTLSFQFMGKIGGRTATMLGADIAGTIEDFKGHHDEAKRLYAAGDADRHQLGQDWKDFWSSGDRTGKSASDAWRSNPDFSGFLDHQNDLDSRESGKNGPDDLFSAGLNPNNSSFSAYMNSLQGRGTITDETLSNLMNSAGKQYNVNPALLAAIIKQESGGNTGAVSRTGAQGLMQLEPGTAKQYGVTDSFDPSQNVMAGAHYISDLLKRYDYDLTKALAAYNAGPAKVDRYGGVPPYDETKNYVMRVLREFSYLSNQSQGGIGDQVHVGTVNIYVPHTLPEDQWKGFVHESMRDLVAKNSKTTMAQTAGGAFF